MFNFPFCHYIKLQSSIASNLRRRKKKEAALGSIEINEKELNQSLVNPCREMNDEPFGVAIPQ